MSSVQIISSPKFCTQPLFIDYIYSTLPYIDINYDGFPDVILGCPYANDYTGATYVIFGGRSRANVVLSAITNQQGFEISGAYNNANSVWCGLVRFDNPLIDSPITALHFVTGHAAAALLMPAGVRVSGLVSLYGEQHSVCSESAGRGVAE